MKTVVVCATKKFKADVKKFCIELRKLGIVVYEPNISEPINESNFFPQQKSH